MLQIQQTHKHLPLQNLQSDSAHVYHKNIASHLRLMVTPPISTELVCFRISGCLNRVCFVVET